MSHQFVGFTLLSVGLASFLKDVPSPKVSLSLRKSPAPESAPRHRLPSFTLQEDVPALGLKSQDVCRVEPDAPIRVGDPVIVRKNDATLLTPYRDELLLTGVVVGKVVHSQPASLRGFWEQ